MEVSGQLSRLGSFTSRERESDVHLVGDRVYPRTVVDAVAYMNTHWTCLEWNPGRLVRSLVTTFSELPDLQFTDYCFWLNLLNEIWCQ